jgi:hypothetical protein
MKYANQTIKIAGTNCKQVSKKTAQKLFSKGSIIYLHPCNMILYSYWANPCPISLDKEEVKSKIEWAEICKKNNYELNYTPSTTPELQFLEIVSNFEMYNCIAELGKYANFFVPDSN